MNKVNMINYNDSNLFPRFSNGENWEFDFYDDFYTKFNLYIMENPGLTSEEYAEQIDFYNFTPESITKAFKLFNTYQCTFYRKCGPFMLSNNKWYSINKLNDYDKFSLIDENKKLKIENKFLREKIDEIVKKSMDF